MIRRSVLEFPLRLSVSVKSDYNNQRVRRQTARDFSMSSVLTIRQRSKDTIEDAISGTAGWPLLANRRKRLRNAPKMRPGSPVVQKNGKTCMEPYQARRMPKHEVGWRRLA
ncbi:hypothetical protein BIW11_01500 [Tropilaelaps mercedesae]|uniref:Uncharacterized protein n=1 Tax=Tropilaelaps mercedesae TaxID=418985 RepID=A0A1V9XCY5_9ACAR|nr:hypothetical protein BIW11_01500 [Tropilaelaps mercedesae]